MVGAKHAGPQFQIERTIRGARSVCRAVRRRCNRQKFQKTNATIGSWRLHGERRQNRPRGIFATRLKLAGPASSFCPGLKAGTCLRARVRARAGMVGDEVLTSEYMSLLIIAYHLALRALDHFSRARHPRLPHGTLQPALCKRASHAVN